MRPVVIHHHHPERIIERPYHEGYRGEDRQETRHTGPIVVPVPERIVERTIVVQPPIQQGTRDEPEAAPSPVAPRDQKERTGYPPNQEPIEPPHRPPVGARLDPVDKQKEFTDPNKNNSGEPRKTIPPENKNNSPTELFEPDAPAPQAAIPEIKKIGKPGRQRRYEELGIDDIEPIKELVLFRQQFGKHWPGLSKDMEAYYERFYFSRPNKRKDGDDYDRHVKCWERRERWLHPTQAQSA